MPPVQFKSHLWWKKEPCLKDLENEIQHFTETEKKIIISVIQKDIEWKKSMAIDISRYLDKDVKDILHDWNQRISNMQGHFGMICKKLIR